MEKKQFTLWFAGLYFGPFAVILIFGLHEDAGQVFRFGGGGFAINPVSLASVVGTALFVLVASMAVACLLWSGWIYRDGLYGAGKKLMITATILAILCLVGLWGGLYYTPSLIEQGY